MNRYAYALAASSAPQQVPLSHLAMAFTNAVCQVVAEEGDPTTDPAVIVLGSFIAFHVHADVNTRHGYQQLLSECEQRMLVHPELQ